MDLNKIGVFIKELRLEKNMNQEELANMIPIGRAAVSKWENGKTLPNSDVLVRLSEIFNVSINEILCGERINKKNAIEINEVTLELYTKNGKRKKTIIFLGTMLVFLIIGFLMYYFLASFKSVKVYNINGTYEDNLFFEGILISTKEKYYLKIYETNNLDIDRLTLYYDNDQKYIIVSNSNNYISLEENVGYQEYFSNFEDIIDYLYLEVEINGNIYDIPLDVELDYINKNFIYKKYNSIGNDVDSVYSYNTSDLIECLKSTFTMEENVYKYYLSQIEYTFIDISNVLYVSLNDGVLYTYYLDSDYLIYESTDYTSTYEDALLNCTSEECLLLNENISSFNNILKDLLENCDG